MTHDFYAKEELTKLFEELERTPYEQKTQWQKVLEQERVKTYKRKQKQWRHETLQEDMTNY